MMSALWQLTDNQRRTVLLMEGAALLHDIGKLTSGFLRSQSADGSGSKYEYELLADPKILFHDKGIEKNNLPSKLKKPLTNDALQGELGASPAADRADLTDLFKSVTFDGWNENTQKDLRLGEILLLGHQRLINVSWSVDYKQRMEPAWLLGTMHGAAHFEKQNVPPSHQPSHDHIWRSSPFGHPLDRFDLDADDGPDAWFHALPVAQVEDLMDQEKRWAWLAEMERLLKRGVADTRRPFNEVTLWDWSYVVAAMTKAGVVYQMQNAAHDQSIDPKQCQFRTLAICLNRLPAYAQSDKISDLLGVQQALDDSFQQVRTLLEVELALGNRLYHDETGVYYLLPDMPMPDALTGRILACFPPDLRPRLLVGDTITVDQLDTSRETILPVLLTDIRTKARTLAEFPVDADQNLVDWQKAWTDERPANAEICTVCRIRPVGYPRSGTTAEGETLPRWATLDKAQDRTVCRICLGRRGRRSASWIEQGLSTTIWTDEVADANGRLALVVAQFGLDNWLDGSLVETLQAGLQSGTPVSKYASPVRLLRIAETGRSFWQQHLDDSESVRSVPARLAIYPPASVAAQLRDGASPVGDFHVYELLVNGEALSVVWDSDSGRLVTAENLTGFVNRSDSVPDEIELADLLQGETWTLWDPSSFGQPSQPLTDVPVETVELLSGYQPLIPLLTEPSLCMVLVPAQEGLAFVDRLHARYAEQMARVRDRLPLHVGLVFFPRRTPMRAVLEAGQSMLRLDDLADWEQWTLDGATPADGRSVPISPPGEAQDAADPVVRHHSFQQAITWTLPLSTDSEGIPDGWYPYVYTQSPAQSADADVRHMAELTPGDTLWLRAGRFDFEFLDATGRRFDIVYEQRQRLIRPSRPFLLDDLKRLTTLWQTMRKMKGTQRYRVVQTIESIRETWSTGTPDLNTSPVFRQFVQDSLAGATWSTGSWSTLSSTNQHMLVEAGVQGELADLLDLYKQILKEREAPVS